MEARKYISVHQRMDKDDVIIHTQPKHAQEYHLAIKKNKIMPFVATCMDLEII